jgi:hypothetical protein
MIKWIERVKNPKRSLNMPRGDYFKNPENSKKRLEKRLESRKELISFFIKINNVLSVSRDSYNVILMLKIKAESGKYYYQSYFYSYLNSPTIIKKMKELGAKDAEIAVYIKKIKDIQVSYKDGDLILDLPEDFKADERDVEVKTEEEGD